MLKYLGWIAVRMETAQTRGLSVDSATVMSTPFSCISLHVFVLLVICFCFIFCFLFFSFSFFCYVPQYLVASHCTFCLTFWRATHVRKRVQLKLKKINIR